MVPVLIIFAFSILCWIGLLYPYVIYPMLLSAARQRPVATRATYVRFTMMFCAFNEIASIRAKIANLRELKARHPGLEILAYDDGSTDGTTEILAAASDLLTLVEGEGRRGKATGMRRLAALARGEVLVLTDANVLCAPDALARLAPYYGDPEVGGVCGTLRYENEESSATAEVGAEYWSLDEKLRSLESATGNVMGADGSIFSIRRALYPSFPDTVLDDFATSMAVVFAGKRLVKAPDVVAYERSVVRSDEEFRRKIRIGTRAYHTHAWMRPRLRAMSRLDRFKYVSRKFLRWFGGGLFAAGLASGLAGVAMLSPALFLAASALVGLGFALVLGAKRGPLARIGEIVRALMATQIGVWRGMRGRTVTTWAPAVSR